MKYSFFCLLLILVCHGNLSFGQGNTSIDLVDVSRKSSFHIQTFPQKNFLLFNFGSKLVDVNLFPSEESTVPIEIFPNLPAFVGVGASLFDFNFVINVKIPGAIQNTDEFGRTSGYFLYARIFTNHFIYDLNYKELKGFYIPPYNDVLENRATIKLTNTRLKNVSARVSYIFSPHKYVTGIGKRFGIRQKRSAGSFMLIGGFGHYATIDLDEINTGLPEEKVIKNVGEFELNQNFIAFLGGYGHNYVIKRKFVVHIKGTMGLAFHYNVDDYSQSDAGIQFGYNISLIYDNGNWFSGLEYMYDVDLFDKGVNSVVFSAQYLTLSIGKRFLKKGLLSKYSIFDLIPWYNRKKY